jgi:DNA-binding CsgD family transcriptional regulator
MVEKYTFGKIGGARHRRRPIAVSWDHSASDAALRNSGIPLLGDIPWGTHICLFYETKEDLLDSNVAYFKAGIEKGEFGLWAISDPISMSEANVALRLGIPGFDRYLADGHFEIVAGRDWYLPDGEFQLGRIIERWHKKNRDALASGHGGLRISGNALWQRGELWKDFCDYERTLDKSIRGHQMLVLCTYSLEASRARDVLDVARVHQGTLARRNGEWEYLKVPTLEKMRNEIRLMNGDLDVLSRPFPGWELLTTREKIVLAQIVGGASSKAAAHTLKISPRTIEFHRANIMQKLGTRNIAGLIRLVLGDS